MISTALAGFGLGLSLIVAIGAQNLFVLRQGVRREYALVVAAVCAVSDAVLILLGVSGIGLALEAVPWLIDVVRIAGCVFLVTYGLLAARRAWRPSGEGLDVADAGESETDELRAGGGAGATRVGTATVVSRTRLRTVVLTCLALTWLNPHVYLDTVFLLGSVAGTYGDARWWFAAGAVIASIVWFFGLVLGARHLGRWLATPRAWRVLDTVIAVIMIALGISLVLP